MEGVVLVLAVVVAIAVVVVLKKRKQAKKEDSTPVAENPAPAVVTTVPETVAKAGNGGANITIYYDPECPDWPAQKLEYLKKYPNANFIPNR